MQVDPFNKNKTIAEDPVIANEKASDERAAAGNAEIERFDEILPGHPALEDMDEVSSTDDV